MVDPARTLWQVTEPFHALTYFAPECHEHFEAAGLRGFWRGYFAGRAAPLGTVAAGPVIAMFYGFRADFVRRALPSVWKLVSPDDALRARLAGVAAAVRALEISTADLATPAGLLRRAVADLEPAARPLYAANAELDWPTEPAAALWQATTLLREHRGDGHVAALTSAAAGPCEAHVLRVVCTGQPLESIQPYRGWDADDWSRAAGDLSERGWLDGGTATAAGHDTYDRIEAETDRLAAGPVTALGPVRLAELVVLLTPIAERLRASGVIPYPNPIGVTPPSA